MEIIDQRLRAGLLRRPGPGVAARHPAPGPRARATSFATGAIEQPLVFAGNDLPGVMLSGGARRLAALYAVSPGKRAVIATTSDRGLHAAAALRRVGVQIVAVADLRPEAGALADALRARRDPRVQRPHGDRGRAAARRVSEAIIAAARRGGRSTRSSATWSSSRAARSPPPRCCCRPARTSALRRRRGHFALAELPDGVFAAGEVAGDDSDAAVAASGRAGRAGGRRTRWACGDDASPRARSELQKRLGRRRRGPTSRWPRR